MTDPRPDPPDPDPSPGSQADASDPFPTEPQLRLDPGGHTARIVRTAVDRAGHWLVSGSEDKTVRVWRIGSPGQGAGEPAGCTQERTIRVPLGPGNLGKVYAVALSPDGETLAVGGWLGSADGLSTDIYIFDRAAGTLRQRLGGLPNVVHHLAFDHSGERLAALLHGGEGLRLYGSDVALNGRQSESKHGGAAGPVWTEIGRDPDYGDNAYWANFAADGRLATACWDGRVRLYGAEDAGVNRSHSSGQHSALSDPGQRLGPIQSTRPPGGKGPFSIAFSPDGTRIAVGYLDSTVVDLLDGRTLAHVCSADTGGIGNGNLGTVTWSGDGGTLYAGGRYQEVDWDPVLGWSNAGLGPRVAPIRAAKNTVMTLHGLPDGSLAVGAQDGIFLLGPADWTQDPQILWSSPIAAADFRGQIHDKGIRLSASGDRVAFGYEQGGKRPALLDLTVRTLTLDPSPKSLADLALPDEGPAPADPSAVQPNRPVGPRPCVTGWVNDTEPKQDGRPLGLYPKEIARSLALTTASSPKGLSLCLGADWTLRAYSRDGQPCWQQPVPGVVWALNVTRDGRYAVAGYGDGTLRWHRLADGAEVLAFYPCPDPAGVQPRWVLWTPLGHYAASAGGEDLIGWHLNRGPDRAPDFFGASRLRERFNRPDVIALVLETGDPLEALRRADAARGLGAPSPDGARATAESLPPLLRLLSPQGEMALSGTRLECFYKAESSGAPVDRIEARVDGRPVILVRDDRHAVTDGGCTLVGQLTLEVPPGPGVLTLVAFSRNGSSEPALLPLRWTGAEDWRKPRLYGLAVGVDTYPAGIVSPLRFAARDALSVADELESQSGGLYKEVQVRRLTDSDARRESILDGLQWLVREVGQRDVAVVFLAGHGLKDDYEAYYYLCVDGDPATPYRHAVKGADIADFLRRIAGKVVLMLDTCYSGALLGDARAGTDSLPDLDRFANELADADTGVVVFSSSTGRQLSREHPDWGHGAFTFALLEAIRDGRADFRNLGVVTLAELESYLADRVKELTGGKQHPTVTKPKAVSDYRVFRVRSKVAS